LEEIGLDLASYDYLGRISDLVGAHLPIQVSCYVYGLTGDIRLCPNHEVSEFFWVPISELSAPDRHLEARVHFGGQDFVRPAIRLPQGDKPLLWGITYRLIMELLQILSRA
jgi:8-oxo-dGTP pyrophosphatase MutT (NUDIX family)